MTHEPSPAVTSSVQRAPGVYFGLDDATYHADAALGSTDIKTLAFSPCDYWFRSPLNPGRPEDEPTPSQLFGSAVHKHVLEGSQAFASRYAATDHNGSTKAGKEERAAIAESGRVALKREDYERIEASAAMIRANATLEDAFSGGMPEVSIFWESGGIRRKCRIDYLKARASVDLKSIRNTRNLGFPEACRRAISDYRYDIQAEHYRQGRNALATLVAEGAVHGDHDPGWLGRIARASGPAFVFVFYQAEGAPLTWGTVLSPANPILDIAREAIARAEANYREHVERFGLDSPWLLNAPLAELELTDMPAWFGRS